MLNRLRRFENKTPEIIFSWKDTVTEAEGWVVINSLRGGAAGGGTRMRKGLDLKEVISLAKTMEIKFEVSGPHIGGAKSGINFDPTDPRKKGVLKRWFNAVIPLLKSYYGTGGDLNVDEIKDVMPITSSMGLMHPQEGIVNGHLKVNNEGKHNVLNQLQEGVAKIVTDPELSPDITHPYTVSDLSTGYGVASAALHYYNIWGGSCQGKRVIIQGFGNVGGPTGYYLAQAGMKIVGITDHEGGIINNEGFNASEIADILKNREKNLIKSSLKLPLEIINRDIWKTGAEVFIPAAGSRLVSKDNLDTMVENGLELISCGANVPFGDEEIFFGPTGLYADNTVSVIPDFIANCGMARTFAYLMQPEADLTDKAIFNDISDTIRFMLERVHDFNTNKLQVSQNAMEIVLNSIE